MADKTLEQADAFAEKVAAVLEDNLVSLFLFGSAARPGYTAAHQDANLFLIVRDASTTAIRPIEPAVAEWVRKHSPPVIVSETEWKRSTDVFPIEIEDMRDAHRLLKGTDPFDGLETTERDLRHELERELRGKLLQLRSEFAAAAPDGKRLTALLVDSITTFFVLMRALVRLTGGTPGADPATLVQQASEAANLDADAFDWVVRKITGQTVRALDPYDPVGARYVDEIEKMAGFVDRHAVSPPAPAAGTAD